MAKAIRIHQTGGPDVLRYEDVQVGDPGPGEARLRHAAIGVNYIDTYHRTGLYKLPLPVTLGLEGAGVVEAVGSGVAHVQPGDRVAYAGGPPGGYAEQRLIPADRLVKLPREISDEQAAAAMLKGLTVWYLVRKTYRVQRGETVLWHAAAGGVGLIACQWLRALGVTTIGTVGSDEKAKLAKAHGCDHTVVYTREDFAKRVRELTNGAGVPVVYDAVGKDTFAGSLDSLRPRGLMVSFGNASGPTGPIDPLVLSTKGSLFLTRPTLAHHTGTRAELEEGTGELFELLRSGKVKIDVSGRYPLSEAARAHRDLEARKTTGSLVLLPGR
ncbi:MAG TPA: quinone oxidoreductase [Anaeromyxobacteraceae bacterium]|nr:quinone oxidoreductase [Anaeromyxobacteraceae bacterium]